MGPTRWKPIPLPEGFGAGLALQDLEEILQQKSSKENIHVFLRATLGFIVEPAKPNAQEIWQLIRAEELHHKGKAKLVFHPGRDSDKTPQVVFKHWRLPALLSPSVP